MKSLTSMPTTSVRQELSIPQIRVLRILGEHGAMTRAKISDKCGNQTNVVVGRAVGYSDPDKRAVFENTKDGGFRESLLTLRYVEEIPVSVEGVEELLLRLTPAGRDAFAATECIELPPLRNDSVTVETDKL